MHTTQGRELHGRATIRRSGDCPVDRKKKLEDRRRRRVDVGRQAHKLRGSAG